MGQEKEAGIVGAQPEAEPQSDDLELVITIHYVPRTGKGHIDIDPPELAGRRDLVRAALFKVEEGLHYAATTAIAGQKMAHDIKQAQVDAMKQELARGKH